MALAPPGLLPVQTGRDSCIGTWTVAVLKNWNLLLKIYVWEAEYSEPAAVAAGLSHLYTGLAFLSHLKKRKAFIDQSSSSLRSQNRISFSYICHILLFPVELEIQFSQWLAKGRLTIAIYDPPRIIKINLITAITTIANIYCILIVGNV